MFKKFLAALTTLALSLGMVALTAGPASAHAGNITASAVCNPATGKYDVTYKLSWSNIPNGVTAPIHTRTGTTSFDHGWSYPGGKAWTDRGVTSGASGSIQWTESLPGTTKPVGPWVYAYTPWSNNHDGATKHDTQVVGLAGNCGLPDDTSKKVVVCHYDNGQNGKYTLNDISVSAVLNGQDHASNNGTHAQDIIPPFTYVNQGVSGSYPGKNWTTYGQWVFNNGCSNALTPTAPQFQDAVCTVDKVPGTSGQYFIPNTNTDKIAYYVAVTTSQSAPNHNAGAWQLVATKGVWVNVAVGKWVHVRAEGINGYSTTGTDQWKGKIGAPTDAFCLTDVDPKKPEISQATCVANNDAQGSYTIPNIGGLEYRVYNPNTGEYEVKLPGVYPANDNTTVHVRVYATSGYDLTDTDHQESYKSYSLQFSNYDDSKCQVPTAPDKKYSECTTPGQSSTAQFFVPTDSGVVYKVYIDDVLVPTVAGWNDVTGLPKTVKIVASAASGNVIVPGSLTEWTYQFASAGDCLDEATPVKPTFENAVCTEPGTGTTSGYYIIHGAANVTYEVKVGDGAYTPVDPATYGDKVDVAASVTVLVKAIPADGYKLVGYTEPYEHVFTDPGDCLDKAVPGDPKFVDSICKADTTGSIQATYEVVAAANVTYEVSTNGVDYTSVGAAVGIHNVTPPTHIWIKAIADPGYKIEGKYIWDHEFVYPGDCLDDAPVEPVVASDQVCVVDNPETLAAHLESGTITIPNTAHVTYSVNGVAKGAGEYDYAPGVYTISAVADAGYKLTNVPADPWTVEIKAAKICGQLPDLPLVDPLVTFKQTTCSASGSYTLAADPVSNAAGIAWTVSGGLPNTLGTHSVTTPGVVNITATALGPDYGFPGDRDGIKEWSYDFASLPDDCLPTLALTGGSLAAGGLGFGALLTLGGILVFNARKRELVANAE